jgi:hypothetical protein
MNVLELLQAWWDFIDEDNTAPRKEYTEEEQYNLMSDFIYKNIISKQD